MFHWAALCGLRPALDACRLGLSSAMQWIPEWVRFSLPGGLWLYSFLAMLKILWRGTTSWHQSFWFAIATVSGVASELLQGVGLVAGVFDAVDLSFYVGAALLFKATPDWVFA